MGGSSVEAAKTLRKAGYAEVYPLRGGLNGWIGANRRSPSNSHMAKAPVVVYSTAHRPSA